MGRLLGAVRQVSRYGLWFGGGLILLAAVLICIDVILRKFFDRSIGGADELSGYALAIGSAWAMPATLLDRGHIRIDSLYTNFSIGVRVWLDLLGLALFVAFFALIGWHGIGVAWQSWQSASRSESALQTPLVVPETVWVIGLFYFVIVGLVLMACAAVLIARNDRAAVVRLIGTRSAQEEVAEELHDLEIRAEAAPP